MGPMMNNREGRRVVLIFGDPDSGKSHLANDLRATFGYHPVSLDSVYVEFIKTRYPHLYFEALNYVIAEHYYNVLPACEARGRPSGAVQAWPDHVASVV